EVAGDAPIVRFLHSNRRHAKTIKGGIDGGEVFADRYVVEEVLVHELHERRMRAARPSSNDRYNRIDLGVVETFEQAARTQHAGYTEQHHTHVTVSICTTH